MYAITYFRLERIRRLMLAIAAFILAVMLLLPQPTRAADISLDGNLVAQCGAATAASNAVTLSNKCGVITTEAITTAAGSEYLLNVTNTVATASDIVLWSVEWAAPFNSGDPVMKMAAVGSGTMQFRVLNSTSRVVQAFSASQQLRIKFLIIKP